MCYFGSDVASSVYLYFLNILPIILSNWLNVKSNRLSTLNNQINVVNYKAQHLPTKCSGVEA